MAYRIRNGIVEDTLVGTGGAQPTEYTDAQISWDAVVTITADATTTGQTLVDITGMTYPVVANATYEFEAELQTVASADANGMEVGVNLTQTPVTIEAEARGNTTTTTIAAVGIQANNTATAAFNTSSAGKGHIFIRGFIQTHATLASTLSIQHLKATSGTSTVKAGSFLKVRRVA